MGGRPRLADRGTRRAKVCEGLLAELKAGSLAPGGRLPSIAALCARFGTGRSTVQLALGELEARGRIQRRHGSGTYVAADADALQAGDGMLLCMPVSGHVFADLYGLLMKELHGRQRIPLVVDTSAEGCAALLRRALQSSARTLVINGGMHFPFRELQEPSIRGKTLIGVVAWETDVLRDRVHRVLVDQVEAGRTVARHLHDRGHRRILLLGTETQAHFLEHEEPFRGDLQRGLAATCRGLGLDWRMEISSHWVRDAVPLGPSRGDLILLDEKAILRHFRGRHACTAAFGFMDAHAWALQDLLARRAPDLAGRVEIVGYGATPWSQFATPRFASVSWNIEAIAQQAALLVEAAHSTNGIAAGRDGPVELYVKPRLVPGERTPK